MTKPEETKLSREGVSGCHGKVGGHGKYHCQQNVYHIKFKSKPGDHLEEEPVRLRAP